MRNCKKPNQAIIDIDIIPLQNLFSGVEISYEKLQELGQSMGEMEISP